MQFRLKELKTKFYELFTEQLLSLGHNFLRIYAKQYDVHLNRNYLNLLLSKKPFSICVRNLHTFLNSI